MQVDTISKRSEVEACVDLYLKDNDGFMPADRLIAIKNLDALVRQGKFARVLKVDGVVVAFIVGLPTGNLHSDTKILQQTYFGSSLKGLRAVRAVQLLHDQLYAFAERNKFEVVMSCGSHVDSDNTFVRILERHGWMRKHYVAMRRTSHYRE